MPGPQTAAYNSDADIIGYGGAAGGGKTDLIAGLTLTKHERALIVRREKAQTEGFVQRMTEIMGGTDGYNSQKGFWRLPGGRLCELAGLDNPGDERRWQGRPHDLKAFDEVTEQREQQVRFVMGWNRTNKPGQRSRVLMTFNPPTTSEGRWVIDFFAPWLDKKHPLYPTAPGALRWVAMLPDGNGGSRDTWFDSDGNPLSSAPFVLVGGRVEYDFDPADYNPEDIIQPKSRTFIPARVTDNPYYVDSGYLVTLQSLPEPLRSQMLYGDFNAGIEDDPWQVIPTAWVEAAQARWKRPDRLAPMDSLGVDVARGGRDNTILARRHAMWFDVPLTYPGKDTPDGPTVAGLAIAALRDHAVIHLDVIGVGASPYDFLAQAKQQVVGVNVAEAARGTDKSGRLRFFNLRSELWWRMREALDPTNNTGIALPPDPRLLADLTAPTWSLSGATLKVASREDIIEKIGRSPDFGSAYVLALMDTPKRAAVEALGQARSRLDYDPYARM
ncbi:terminase [Bordetella bronchiseptica]|nr:terminase [Bordetella bronchiseptica]